MVWCIGWASKQSFQRPTSEKFDDPTIIIVTTTIIIIATTIIIIIMIIRIIIIIVHRAVLVANVLVVFGLGLLGSSQRGGYYDY